MVNAKLKKALAVIDACEMAKIEALPNVNIAHSPEYLEKIKSIFELAEKKTKRLAINKIIAIIAAAVLILALSITAYAFREPIFNFFEETFGNRLILISNGAKVIEKEMTIGYIPENFVSNSENHRISLVQFEYRHKDTEKSLIYEQYPGASTQIGLNMKELNCEKIIDGETVYYKTEKGDLKTLTWRDSEYAYQIACYADISWEEILKSAQSITIN